MSQIEHFYRRTGPAFEYCFNIETSAPLTKEEHKVIRWILAETFEPEKLSEKSFFTGHKTVEFGPRLNFATTFSSNAVSICHSTVLNKVTRIEKSKRYTGRQALAASCDRMTEMKYQEPISSFLTGLKPEPVFYVPILEQGVAAVHKINQDLGLSMDKWDEEFYTDMFANYFLRNATNVECFQLGNCNSEHSRHWFFKGKQVIDGKEMPLSLLEMVKSAYKVNPNNSIIAFSDNSSAIRGYDTWTIIPAYPGQVSPFKLGKFTYHILFTAETHNFPSGVAPFPGAETGTGGRIRDVQATGKGGLVIAGTAGYCVGNLNIPGYRLRWEDKNFNYPGNLASPLKIEIDASNGASDYGNKFGEPVIQGFTRSFGLRLPNGERREWLKPIMFTGGIGQLDHRHIRKGKAKKGMKILEIGGPGFRIGVGGGAASSMIQGENKEVLDFNAVQRGDAEMEQKMNRVVRACVEMGRRNPIVSIHDQGAGGPCNVLTELIDPAGGRINIRKIKLGDQTLSVLEIWSAEYQERNGLLIWPDRLTEFKRICRREKVNCEVLGRVTGDGRVIVYDSLTKSKPVDLELAKILGKMPQKTFKSDRIKPVLKPLRLPRNLTVAKALKEVFKDIAVGSKQFLTRKVDRSVTGLIARQQCCGPLQLPVSDVAVVAQSHFGLTGAAIAIGEQPIKMLVNTKAGARMAIGEALTNLACARISALEDIKYSGNWMWAAKLPGEGAALYDAVETIDELSKILGIAEDGGKDSISMAAKVGVETVKAPGELVVSAYVTMSDVTKVLTPDIKKPGETRLMLIDLAPGKYRLGGSALAHVYGQIGGETPDVDDPELLRCGFNALQSLIDRGYILSCHDKSDGGLIATLAEMALSGNCGMLIRLDEETKKLIPKLFAEELGWVVEYLPAKEDEICYLLNKLKVPHSFVGTTQPRQTNFAIFNVAGIAEQILDVKLPLLRRWWEATSYQLDRLQANPKCVDQEKRLAYRRHGPEYRVGFKPEPTGSSLLMRRKKPKVAIIREEGSNGDREMTSVFYAAGFEPWDVTMTDLLTRKISLKKFRGVVSVGGFSYADVLDSAKGWAATIRFNSRLKKMFDEFYDRPDTFSLAVCNGCQLDALLGWVPWRGIPDAKQPRFIRNESQRFESNWVTVNIRKSPAIMLQGMDGSTLGIWVAHGEGRFYCPDGQIMREILEQNLAPIVYVSDNSKPTEKYPFNPNGSPNGITALCSPDGRHLAMMPHPERAFLLWQWAWLPEDMKRKLPVSPWLKMFQNAREWCENHK